MCCKCYVVFKHTVCVKRSTGISVVVKLSTSLKELSFLLSPQQPLHALSKTLFWRFLAYWPPPRDNENIYKASFQQLHGRPCGDNILKRHQTGGKSSWPLSFNTGLQHSLISPCLFMCFCFRPEFFGCWSSKPQPLTMKSFAPLSFSAVLYF